MFSPAERELIKSAWEDITGWAKATKLCVQSDGVVLLASVPPHIS